MATLSNRISTMIQEEIHQMMYTVAIIGFTVDMRQWLTDNVGPEQHVGEWCVESSTWGKDLTLCFKQYSDAIAFKLRFSDGSSI